MFPSPFGPFLRACLRLVPAAGLVAPAGAQLVINELLPDPDGSDAGHEFVELYNPGEAAIDLGGWQLQFANGAEAASWATRWSGTSGRLLPPGGLFLIVDRNWTGPEPGDAEVSLALQNGPDAIRLTQGGRPVDLVGYGALTDPELMESAPAPIAVGRSTARRPDGHDTGSNAADFVISDPTPGTINFARRRLVLVEATVEPPSLARAGEVVLVEAELRNEGLEALPTSRVRLVCGADVVEATLDAMDTGQQRRVAWALRPSAAGRWPLVAERLPADDGDTLRTALAGLQVGPAGLLFDEALAGPRAGQGEWFELSAPGPEPVSTEGYRVRDEDGGWVALPPLFLAPGERAIIAQDTLALGGWLAANAEGPGHAGGCGAALRRLSPWPTLNNSAPDSRAWADRILLADSSGTIIDHVTIDDGYPGSDDGRSWERRSWWPPAGGASNWASSLAAAGSTPGCPNSVAAPEAAGERDALLNAVPPVADRAAGDVAIHLGFSVPEGSDGWELVVYDLDGRQVRDLGGDRHGAGPRNVFWDLRDDAGRAASAGGFVAALRLTSGRTAGPAIARRVLVIR